MKILVDIVHPADVLFFLHPMRRWLSSGHRLLVASRNKDVTGPLLDAFGIEHEILSTAGSGLGGLALELVRRDVALLRVARSFRPDVMCGFGGVAISHVGKLTGTPAISFYDTERAPLQNALSLPFITHLYVPESYCGPIAKGRTSRFPGTKENSYLHPDNFAPDPAAAIESGLDDTRVNFFVRLVAWQANHDAGLAGWDEPTLREFIDYLAAQGKVHISAEFPLPAALAKYAYRGQVHQVHHLLAHCACYIGESATMASEAVTLGVPAIYATPDRRWYTDYLEKKKLLWKVPVVDSKKLAQAVETVLGLDRQEWSIRVHEYHRRMTNLAVFVEQAVLRHAAGDGMR